MKLKQMRFVTANHDEILNTWLKFFITWPHESQFMNVLFIRIEILKCNFAFSLSQFFLANNDLGTSNKSWMIRDELRALFGTTLDVNVQNKSVYISTVMIYHWISVLIDVITTRAEP